MDNDSGKHNEFTCGQWQEWIYNGFEMDNTIPKGTAIRLTIMFFRFFFFRISCPVLNGLIMMNNDG